MSRQCRELNKKKRSTVQACRKREPEKRGPKGGCYSYDGAGGWQKKLHGTGEPRARKKKETCILGRKPHPREETYFKQKRPGSRKK